MSEKSTDTEKTLEYEIEALKPRLEGFATKYAPIADAANLSDVAKKALANRRRFAQDALGLKTYYVTKAAEKCANAHDLTFKAERAIASTALNGQRWQRILVSKNADLTFLLGNIIAKIKTVATVVHEPDSIVEPYAGYFEMKCRAALAQFRNALDIVYNGKPSWNVFANVKDTIATAWRELREILETEGVSIPGTVMTWLKESETAAVAA